MLVLTRKIGEKIVIDHSITVTITAIDGNKVRIGVTAPPDVSINREEVQRRIAEFAESTAEVAVV